MGTFNLTFIGLLFQLAPLKVPNTPLLIKLNHFASRKRLKNKMLLAKVQATPGKGLSRMQNIQESKSPWGRP